MGWMIAERGSVGLHGKNSLLRLELKKVTFR